jgi:cobalt/nickel transport system permease protein
MRPPDVRLRLGLLFGYLAAVSLGTPPAVGACALFLAAVVRLRWRRVWLRAAAIIPFSATLAAPVWWADGGARAGLLLAKAYLSAAAVALFTLTTPVPQWTAALRAWGVPPALAGTLELIHRYLGLLSSEAARVRLAMRARGGFRFSASAGAVAVLFARAWRRGESLERAMLARGWRGGPV